MDNIVRISLRNWAQTPGNSKDFYYPLLAYECAVSEITNEGDAIQEAILKLLALNENGAAFAAKSIGNVLGGLPEDVVQQALDLLKYKGLIEKQHNRNWKLAFPLNQALSLLFAPTPNREEHVGYMFYNPVRKNILPYFHDGNLFRNRCSEFLPELYLGNKTNTFAVPEDLASGINSEWDTQYALFFHINGKVSRKKEQMENNAAEQMPEIPLEEMGGYEEEEPAFIVEEEKPIVYVDGDKALVKPFKKEPVPVFVRMRIVYDETSEICGYKVESPFPLDNADEFGKNIDYIRFNEAIAEKFTFKDTEQGQAFPLIEYLEAQVRTQFPHFDFEGGQNQLKSRLASRWPRIALLEQSTDPGRKAKYREFLAYFKDIAALEDNPPREWLHKDLHAFTDLVDYGLEGWMQQMIQAVVSKGIQQDADLNKKIEADCEQFYKHSNGRKRKNIMSDWRDSWSIQVFDRLPQTDPEIKKVLTHFLGSLSEKDSDIIHIFNKHFHLALREFKYSSRGNSIVHKLMNIMWLQYKYGYSTKASERLLEKETLADYIRLITPMQLARVAGDHPEDDYIEGETELDREKHCRYIVDHFYKTAERLLDALEER